MPEEVVAFVRGDENAVGDARLRSVLEFAVKLTRAPYAVCERDLAPLRSAGLSDPGIHDLVAIAAYFNFVNRVAAGLGVEIETAPVAGDDMRRE